MQLSKPAEFTFDPGRSLTDEERAEAGKLYPWPRPIRKTCKRESSNDRWRLGKV